jgi:outer membrane protein assembly factor BamE (lipoprotein component of BamABCDE complex)
MKLLSQAIASIALISSAACIQVDSKTGETLPRGDQKYPFSEVKKYAEQLQVGMTKTNALILLGSPAEMSDRRNTWVYLPERPAVLIPARVLKLEFYDGRLKDFGYHAIVLGAQL